jgi:hypothetical protein
VNSFGHLFGGRQLSAFLARSASCLLSFLWQQMVNICVSTHTRDYMSVGPVLPSNRGVKTVCTAEKMPLRQPEGKLCEHLAGQFYQSGPVLPVQSHIDWQTQRFATPGRIYSHCKHYQVQAPGVHYICAGRTNSVSPPGCTIDFSAAAMKQGVVQIDGYYTSWVKYPDQQNCQKSVQLARCPASIWEEAMIRIVSFLSGWVCERQYTGYCSSGGAQYPSGYEVEKDICCWNCENRKKVLDYRIPRRSNNSCVHANLPVVLSPTRTSEGWYVYVHKSLKSAA